jgi:hypothetical protein
MNLATGTNRKIKRVLDIPLCIIKIKYKNIGRLSEEG